MATYSYSTLGGFDSTVDASTAGAAVAALVNGFDSTPQEIVDAARDAASPLHGVFTFEGAGLANIGEESRLERAQALLGAIIVGA